MRTPRKILRAARDCARLACGRLSDMRGMTLRQIFTDAEEPGVTVFWGLWTDDELDTVIG